MNRIAMMQTANSAIK